MNSRTLIVQAKRVIFVLLIVISAHFTASGQGCNCPAVGSCGPCVGDLVSLTLQYNGPFAVSIIATDNSGIIFSAILVSPGQSFTVSGSQGNGKFNGSQLNLYVNAILNFSINTSCATAIGVNSTLGSFTVLAGESKTGGALCCTAATQDIINPVISGCSSNIAVNLVSGCSRGVSWIAPTATDNCGSVALTSTHNPGAIFPKGTTTVIYTATDDYGNTSTCSFNVTVNDNINPVITGCPSNIFMSANASCQAAATWTSPIAADNCAVSSFVASHPSGSTFPIGTTAVTYTATDNSGNTSVCTFNVVVNDNTNPVITGCPTNIIATANGSCETIVTWTAPSASDNCSIATFTSSHTSGSTFPLGTTAVTYTATDVSGNIATCTFNVTVNDNINPVIAGCPSNIIASANASCQAVVTWTAPTASDNCTVSTFSSSHPSGSTFPLGTTLVTYTATDGSGNTSTCTFNVTVNDNTNPVITGCPPNISLPANASCQAIGTWTLPTAVDNCSVSTFTGSHTPGSSFPLGTTLVTYTATDGKGNTSTCTFNVTVTDNTNPVVSGCPSTINVAANASCEAVVNWTAPTASDNCSISTFTSTHAPGSTFPSGTTVVTYTATDAAGNSSVCSFNVIVTDNTDPVIAGCPSNISLSANASCQAIAAWTAPTASDNCSVSTFTSSHASGSTFALGTTVVTYTATDVAGNISTCSFNVIVNDNTNPVITGCPTNITTTANASCQAVVSWTVPTASDNCSVSTFTTNKAPGSTFPLGVTTVTYTATDAKGNVSTCSFDITVNDNTNPVITGCPSNITTTANASCQATVSWTAPTASDNCTLSTFTSNKTPGSTFPLGISTVTYTATDANGNISTCSFTVTVNDNVNPVITGCPANVLLTASGACEAVGTWVPPTAADNCSIATFTSTKTSGSTFPIGTTMVTYTATDGTGNTATCSFNVIVSDNTNPVIYGCPPNVTVPANGSCQAVVNWTPPTTTDNCGTTTLVSTFPPGATFPLGTTQVKYTSTDGAGNSSVCTFNVIVQDNTMPVISGCPASSILATANASCQANVTWTAPTAADNCSGLTFTSTHSPGSVFPIGTTQVKYTATDGSGNSSTCTFDVVVSDATNPVITGCPSTITLSANASCQAVGTWTAPTATDNCGTPSLISTHTSGSLFPIGTTQVKYTATDAAGHTSICTFNVIVNDGTNPIISGCPSNISLSANGSCQAVASWTPPTASDNCGVPTLVSTHAPGSTFPMGTTQVKYTATDAAGKTSTCTFNVIVSDANGPVIAGYPSDITLSASASCQATVHWIAPTATDNCGVPTLTSTHTPGSVFPLGTTLVKYTATDGTGNASVCTFNVIVVDDTKPVFTLCISSDIIVFANASCQATATWIPPIATDNCTIVSTVSSHTPGSLFSLGSTVVTYTATDPAGNTATCSFNVIVRDDTNPSFTGCLLTDIQATSTSACTAIVTWTAPTATENCGNVTITSSHQPGASFPIGNTVVTYTATNEAGGLATCAFNVIVKDGHAPVISGCSTVNATANASCEAIVSWTLPSTNDCRTVALMGSHQPGDSFPIGETEVTYSATDLEGNTSTCSFLVIVEDKTVPTFQNCPGDVKVIADAGCSAKAIWTEPIISDNCTGGTITRSHHPGDVFPLGTTVITYTGTDAAGNISTCHFNVVVTTDAIPVITNCPSDVSVESDETGQGRAFWDEPAATTTCGETALASSHPSGGYFPIGTTTVAYTATNTNGKTVTCQFNVVVAQTPIDIDLSKVITPDGNGQNDEWIVTNIEKYRDNKVVIVDRWGSIIYSAAGYNNNDIVWRGSNRAGSIAPTGTYFYTFSVRYGPAWIEKTGFIELIR